MKIHTEIEQGSLDWEILRSGKVTASEMDALISPTGKIRTGDMPKTYLYQKLTELWTGGPLPSLQGIFDMDQGQILEESAKPAFMIETGLELRNVAFIETDDGKCGCSPDGMVGDAIGVEIKCPKMETHIKYLLNGKLPENYIAQVQGSMFVTGFNRWMFYSFSRRMPPLILTIERDEDYQKAITDAVGTFLEALNYGWTRLCQLNGGPPKRKPRSQPESELEPIGITP